MKFSSIFSQVLQLFPRMEFQRLVKETKAERMPVVSPAGGSLLLCFFASWVGRIL